MRHPLKYSEYSYENHNEIYPRNKNEIPIYISYALTLQSQRNIIGTTMKYPLKYSRHKNEISIETS